MNNNIEIIAVLKGEYSSLGGYFFIRICNYIVICLRGFCASNRTIPFFLLRGILFTIESDKIELSGTTGGKDGNFSYTLSDQEKKEFVHLLNQVELGDEVDKNQALSSGAVTYYKLYFQGKDVVTLCPGHYFGVDEKYYEFVNFEEYVTT